MFTEVGRIGFIIMADNFKQCAANSVIFNDGYYIEAMFYADCVAAYPYVPEQSWIDQLKQQQYKFIVLDDTGMIFYYF